MLTVFALDVSAQHNQAADEAALRDAVKQWETAPWSTLKAGARARPRR